MNWSVEDVRVSIKVTYTEIDPEDGERYPKVKRGRIADIAVSDEAGVRAVIKAMRQAAQGYGSP